MLPAKARADHPKRGQAAPARRERQARTALRRAALKSPRQKLVVHGSMVRSRAIKLPVLQQQAAATTSRAPRRGFAELMARGRVSRGPNFPLAYHSTPVV